MPAKPTKKTFNETAAESAGRRLLAELGRFDCDENACMQLIEKGADLNVRDSYNNTALTLAAWHCTDIVLALIERGADVDAATCLNNTALHMAAYNGHGAVVAALIKHGAQLDVRNREDGNTPLLSAVSRRHMDVAKTLIQAGADPNVRDNDNNTALTLVARSSPDIALALIEQGADVNAFGAECNTALHLAACNGRGAVVTALIKRGAQLDARDGRDGNTPLIDAVSQGHADIAKALVNAGADVTVRNRRGVTAANYAERFVPELSAFLEAAEVRQGFANADRAGTPRKRKIRRRTGGISIKP